jgi:glycosyltransferase involved in cell wall biosynthesis
MNNLKETWLDRTILMEDLSRAEQSKIALTTSKVAILCKGDDAYGVASVLRLYAECFPEINFVCLGKGAMLDWLTQNGNKVHLVEGLASFTATSSASTLARLPFAIFRTRKDAARLNHLFQQLGISIVHAHWLPQHIIAGHLRKYGYFSVWHIHVNMNPRRLFGLGMKLNNLLARWGADIIIPVSAFIASNWQEARVCTHTIRNVAKVLFNQPNDLPPFPIRCVIAGRLTEDKGHHLAIQAVINARNAGYDVRLDIFGGPLQNNPYYDKLRIMVAQSGQSDFVYFKGFCSDLRRHHQSYNLGLQCRISPEPCSMWVCETLVDGLPLIAADSGGTAELVNDGITGLLFRSGDAEDLTSKLIILASDPPMANRMRRQAYLLGQNHFSVGRFVAEAFEVYENLLSKDIAGVAEST